MTTVRPELGFRIDEWREAVLSREMGEEQLHDWFSAIDSSDPAWIYLPAFEQIDAQWQALMARRADAESVDGELPLLGVPFAVKDNIDVAGWPTTAACPEFSYVASRDATVVELLRKAGAIVIGKTNLDQFATGLVGTRSPYGIVRSAFHVDYIAGGSSSGSASVVTKGVVPFSLGTDTAGSGRVPAAFGNIVGVKPTRGLFSTKGVVPACRTLDCVSVFANTVADAARVSEVLGAFDPEDPYSRCVPKGSRRMAQKSPIFGVLSPLEFFGDEQAERAFSETLKLLEDDGVALKQVDSAAFFELASLLYGGPWVAERSLTAARLLDASPSSIDPVVLRILEPARTFTAEAAFRYEYRRAELAVKIRAAFSGLDAILVPTTGTTFTVDEVLGDPIETNARLGTYTNFTNLADLCAIAVPGCFREDGLPTGVTLLGPAFADEPLLPLADRVHRLTSSTMGATGRALPSKALAEGHTSFSKSGDSVRLAVVGAHLSGMALNHQLTNRGAKLVTATTTSSKYRLFVLPGSHPLKPGLLRSEEGAQIAIEIWELSKEAFGEFTQEVPAPLGIGNLELADGSWVKGFICEPWGFEGAEDITHFGGFSAYLKQCS